MAVEPKRACGYRTVKGKYILGEGGGIACCKLPIALKPHDCTDCGLDHTWHFTRGWSWMSLAKFDKLTGYKQCSAKTLISAGCPLFDPEPGARFGVIWVGGKAYPNAERYQFEADRIGISRKLNTWPDDLRVGTWVFLAHMKAIRTPGLLGAEDDTWTPGIFRLFQVTAKELIVTDAQMRNKKEMDKLRAKGITPVAVPEDDPDHMAPVRKERGYIEPVYGESDDDDEG